MFIAFEGVDGSGKSTLAPLVTDLLRDRRAVFRAKNHLPDESSFARRPMERLREMLWPGTDIPHLLDYPAHYWALLQSAWYALATAVTVRPIVSAGRVLVSDGWFYKFWAKAAQDGLDFDYLSTVFAHAAVPDLVVHLDVELGAAYDRKREFTFHELGGYQRYAERGRASYMEHQERIRACIMKFVPAERMLTVGIPAQAHPEDNARRLHAAIVERLGADAVPAAPCGTEHPRIRKA